MTHLTSLQPSAFSIAIETRPAEDFTEALRSICGGFAVSARPDRKDRIVGGLAACRFGSYDAAVVALDAEDVRRTAQNIRSDPSDFLFLLFQQKGHCLIDQGSERPPVELLPGDMYLVDSTRPSQFLYRGETSLQISLHIPRDEASARFGRKSLGGIGIDREDPLAFALRATIHKLVTVEPLHARVVGEALMNLIGAYMRCTAGQTADGDRRDDRLLETACLLIARRAFDPQLDPAEVARIVGVSPRTLQRRFEAVGETVSGRILETRLNLAQSVLSARDGGAPPLKIAAAAFECGFNDLSSFYRAFRNRFGTSPGSLSRNTRPDDAEYQDEHPGIRHIS